MIFGRSNNPFVFFGVIVVALILFVVGIQFAVYSMSHTTVRGVFVNDKERIVESDGSSTTSKYLVFTEDEVFENTDHLITFKFDSSDIQGRIKPGQTCDFEVVGWRVPFMSMYRNILSAECM